MKPDKLYFAMAALAAAFLMTSCLDSVDGVSGSFSYDGGKYVINDAKYGYNSFHLGSYGQYIDLYVPEDGKTVELIPGNEKKWSVSINLEDLVLSADNTNPGDVVDGRITWRRSGYDYFEVSFDIRLESGKRLLGGCSGIFPVAVVD